MKTYYSKNINLFKECKLICDLKSWVFIFGLSFVPDNKYRKSLMCLIKFLCFAIFIEFGKKDVNWWE